MNHKKEDLKYLQDQEQLNDGKYNELIDDFYEHIQIEPRLRKVGWLRKLSELMHGLVQTDLSKYLSEDLIDYIISQLENPNNYIFSVAIIKDVLCGEAINRSHFINYYIYHKLITTMPPKSNTVILVCECIVQLLKYNNQIDPHIELSSELLEKFFMINSENSHNYAGIICKLLYHYIIYTEAFDFYDDLIVQAIIIIEHRQNAEAVKWAARELVEIARRSRDHIEQMEYLPFDMISGSDMRTSGVDPCAISALICTLIDSQISDTITNNIIESMNWESLEWGLRQSNSIVLKASVNIVCSLAKVHSIPDSWIFTANLIPQLIEISTNSSSSIRMTSFQSIVYLSKLNQINIKGMSKLIASAADIIPEAPVEITISFIFQLISVLKGAANPSEIASIINDVDLLETIEEVDDEHVRSQLKNLKDLLVQIE